VAEDQVQELGTRPGQPCAQQGFQQLLGRDVPMADAATAARGAMRSTVLLRTLM